ncbi:hypothetical protein B9479_006076 [Cryptococcus floricola]|uniref:Uncharacterized protein n=1 Tax=Cryptococcus floricola TaxID=2591691 RepID=A0A5D3AR97_9TREE|nr:hypothetical protein B9479_006076 [Cryptococcus floricola]
MFTSCLMDGAHAAPAFDLIGVLKLQDQPSQKARKPESWPSSMAVCASFHPHSVTGHQGRSRSGADLSDGHRKRVQLSGRHGH